MRWKWFKLVRDFLRASSSEASQADSGMTFEQHPLILGVDDYLDQIYENVRWMKCKLGRVISFGDLVVHLKVKL